MSAFEISSEAWLSNAPPPWPMALIMSAIKRRPRTEYDNRREAMRDFITLARQPGFARAVERDIVLRSIVVEIFAAVDMVERARLGCSIPLAVSRAAFRNEVMGDERDVRGPDRIAATSARLQLSEEARELIDNLERLRTETSPEMAFL